MILLAIALLTLLLLIAFIVTVGATGGAIFVILFADVIVCIGVLGWIIKTKLF